jgi:hypothetical protein
MIKAKERSKKYGNTYERRNYLNFEQRNWIQLLPKAQYALNDVCSSVTGLTPNQVVFGQEISENWLEGTSETTMEWEKRMKSMQEAVARDIQWKRKDDKEWYDRQRKDAPTLEGNRVSLRPVPRFPQAHPLSP